MILPDGIALITSGGRLVNNSETSKFKGRVYVYEWPDSKEGVKRSSGKQEGPKAQRVNIVPGEDGEFDLNTFNPHGISAWVSKGRLGVRVPLETRSFEFFLIGRINVYIVNHRPDGDAIESFLYDKKKRTLYHSKTIRSDAIYSAFDLVAVGPDKFYVTNSHYFRSWWLQLLEIYLLLNLGNIVYYDGKATIVDNWLSMPTGMGTDKLRK